MYSLNDREKIKGITLLEVLVALAIMSIAVVIIYRTIGGVLRSTETIKDNSYVQIIANSLLDRYQYVGKQGLNVHESNEDFNWIVTSEPFLLGNSPREISLYTVRISISNKDKKWIFETLRPYVSDENNGNAR